MFTKPPTRKSWRASDTLETHYIHMVYCNPEIISLASNLPKPGLFSWLFTYASFAFFLKQDYFNKLQLKEVLNYISSAGAKRAQVLVAVYSQLVSMVFLMVTTLVPELLLLWLTLKGLARCECRSQTTYVQCGPPG